MRARPIAVVTGGAGFIGSHMVDVLVERGYAVRVIDNMVGGREENLAHLAANPDVVIERRDIRSFVPDDALFRGARYVIHFAGIGDIVPSIERPMEYMSANAQGTVHMLECARHAGVQKFVYAASSSCYGLAKTPTTESHPVEPLYPYALSKYFGELLMDAAVRRSDLRCISIRPCWVHHEGNYEGNLGPQVRDPALLSPNFWSYIDVYDLADAIVLAVQSELPGHEVFYIASPDNVGGRPFAEMVRKYYGDKVEIRALARADASGISCAKAMRMLGYAPKRSWRDYLDAEGRLKPQSRR